MMHLLGDAEFWVLIAAVVFVAAVWKPISRTVLGTLDGRAARIRIELDDARRLREEAEQLVADYRTKEREAAAEAEAIVRHARAEAERIATQSARDLEQSLERRRHLAEERIAQAEAQAVDEIRGVAINVAIAAAREVIAAELNPQRGAALIDTAIATLPQRLR